MSKKPYEENFKKQIINNCNQRNRTYRDLGNKYTMLQSFIRHRVIINQDIFLQHLLI